MKHIGTIIIVGSLLCLCTSLVWAWGEEHFGNEPFSEANYTDWPGIMPVINDTNRIYHWWVNGNERFHYRAKTSALNEALLRFAATSAEKREVIVRPGPGVAYSFNRVHTMPYDWNLHLIGGIARHMLTRDKGEWIWSKHPMMTVYIGGGNIELEKIAVPRQVRVVELSDLRERCLKGLESSDKSVRGWGLGELASLDSFNRGNAEFIAKRLEDGDSWVRLNAAHALAEFGKTAEFALPALRKLLNDADEQLKKTTQDTIQRIESAQADLMRVKEHETLLQKIHEFRLAADKR